MSSTQAKGPDWDSLYERASGQAGLFTSKQAAAARYSRALLSKHVSGGKFRRLQRGIYRLVYFPTSEQEELVAAWLWSDSRGVFSHETALTLHGLSDVLPARMHLSVPIGWRGRRLHPPPRVALAYADLKEIDRAWAGSIPVTSVLRTITDCAGAHVAKEFVDAAVRQALDRGLVSRRELEAIARISRSRSAART